MRLRRSYRGQWRSLSVSTTRKKINCAGIALASPFSEYPTDMWDKVVGVNQRGVFLCMREEIAQMERQDFLEYVFSDDS